MSFICHLIAKSNKIIFQCRSTSYHWAKIIEMKKIFTLFIVLILGYPVDAQQLANSGFENWTTSGGGTATPDGWSSWEKAIGAPMGLATKDTSDKKEGLASVKIITDSVLAGSKKRLIPGFVYSGTNLYAPPTPLQFFEGAFTGKPDTLFFWYKYAPAANDTAVVNITASGASGTLLNGAALLTGTSGNWVYTYLLLTPNYAAGTVDSFGLLFSSSKGQGIQGSVLHVDGIRLGYVAVAPTGIQSVKNEIQISLYPNPVSTLITVISSKVIDWADFVVTDVSGKVVLNDVLIGNTSTLNCSELQNGTYFYAVKSENTVLHRGSFVIVK